MNFTDATELSGVRTTQDGYLVADSYALRTGIQTYLGSEVGRDDLQTVAVYRPEEEVFSTDSLSSLSHAPVTDDHPSISVDSKTWRDLAKGEVSAEVLRDGDRLRIPLIVKDEATIQKVRDGKRQLSAGYTAALVWGDGVTPDGQRYQAKQTKIRFNHLAIVDKARAGNEFRIGDAAGGGKDRTPWGAAPLHHDHEPKGPDMTMSTVVLGDKAVQVAASDAPAIEAFKAETAKKIADAETAHAAAIKAKDEEIGTLKADLKKAQDAAPKPADLDKMVADRVALVTAAKAIDKDIVTDGKSDLDIRKAAVAAKYGDEFVKDASEGEIAGMFKALTKDAGSTRSDPVHDALKSQDRTAVNDAWSDSVFASAGIKTKKEG